jgi:hydroxypyruvate reductase
MSAPSWLNYLAALETIRSEALRAVDPRRLVAGAMAFEGGIFTAGERRFVLPRGGKVSIVALGKAASGMAGAAADILQTAYAHGLVVASQRPANLPPRFDLILGGHPLSTQGSLEAGRRIAQVANNLGPKDTLLALVSGGGSALVEHLRPPLSLDDLRQVQQLMLRSGADIRAFNQVRATLSLIKRGGLARMAQPAQTIGLILSDVIGDPLADVASGPTVDVPADAAQARAIMTRLALWEALPATVQAAINEALPAPEPTRPSAYNLLVGSSATAARAAQECAGWLGFNADVASLEVSGEAVQVGRQLAGIALDARAEAGPGTLPRAMIFAGETTVTMRGHGTGGRNQEAALGAAQRLEGSEGVAVMMLATDGVDGNSPAAGAIVSGASAAAARELGYDIDVTLRENDSHALLHALGACVHTGPTGTNVNDLMVALIYP